MEFRNERAPIDGMVTLNEVIEKRREYNKEICITFIDFEETFDKVNREKLWAITKKRG